LYIIFILLFYNPKYGFFYIIVFQPQIGQLDFLLKVLPNYHHFRKSNVKSKSGGPVWIMYTHILCSNKNKIYLIFTLIILFVFIEETLCSQLFSNHIYVYLFILHNKTFLYYIVNMKYKRFNEFWRKLLNIL